MLDNRALNLPRLGVSPKECKVEQWSTGQTRNSLARLAPCWFETSSVFPLLWYCSNQCPVGLISSSLRNHKRWGRVTRCDASVRSNKRLVGSDMSQRRACWLNEWISLQNASQPVLHWPRFQLARCPMLLCCLLCRTPTRS